MKYAHLAVSVWLDPAKLQGLITPSPHGFVCQTKMVSTGVFVLVFYELKRSISSDAGKTRMILGLGTQKRSRSAKDCGPGSYFYKGRQRTNKARSQTKKLVSWRFFYPYIVKLSAIPVKQKNRLQKLSLKSINGFLFLICLIQLRYF